MRASKAEFPILLWIVLAISVALAQEPTKAGWRVNAYFEPTVPTGVIPQFSVELVEPADCYCRFTVKQSLFSTDFLISVDATSGSAPKPSHLLFRIRAAGFSPYLLNTGTLKFDKTDYVSTKALRFTPTPIEVPSVVAMTRLVGGESGSEVLELAVNNPTAYELSATRLAAYGWHNFLGPDQLCDEIFLRYTIELFAKGSQIFGTAKEAGITDLFSYPVQGT